MKTVNNRPLPVKVCGMRQRLNIEALTQLPISFIGLIFYKKSSRFIGGENADQDFLKTIFQTKEIIPQSIKKVGVFVDEEIIEIIRLAEAYQLDYVQLHGNENIFYCKKLKEAGISIIKAFAIDEHFSFTNLKAYEYYCDYFLFDTKGKLPGGNGVSFNWGLLKKYTGELPFFLSGGIKPGMENAILDFEHPKLFALDINSGFENSPGFKNVDLISEFIHKINRVLKKRNKDW